jgi:glycogen debranching enzyme
LGPYIDALVKVYGTKGKELAGQIMKDFTTHFSDTGAGTISEKFDGDSPHAPKGYIAQAWSVGEILRDYIEYGLQEQ